jgi:ferredoxin-NADP reductase
MTDGAVQAAPWQKAVIDRVAQQTPAIKSFFFRLRTPFTHVAGQHVDVRLTAPDGYTAMRSYSIATPTNDTGVLELAIERLSDGEVSPFFHDVAAVGDEIELRGPLGGHFLWPGQAAEPILLIGAGSGLVPLMAMIRQRREMAQTVPTALLLSARTARDVLFSDELQAIELNDPAFVLSLAITREAPRRATDFARRIDSAVVQEVIGRLPRTPAHVFVCGSNGFVNIATDGALRAGLDAAAIKTERYGG